MTDTRSPLQKALPSICVKCDAPVMEHRVIDGTLYLVCPGWVSYLPSTKVSDA